MKWRMYSFLRAITRKASQEYIFLMWLFLFACACSLAALLPFILYVSQSLFAQFFFHSILFNLTLIIPSLFLGSFRNKYIIIIFIILIITGVIYSSHIYLYKGVISPSSFYAIFETNIHEAFEYLKSIVTYKLVIIMFISWCAPIFPLYKILKSPGLKRSYALILSIILVFVSTLALIRGPERILARYSASSAFVAWRQYVAYMEQMKHIASGLNELPLNIVRQPIAGGGGILGIIIVGESASKRHMSVYGYYRDTMPYTGALMRKWNDRLFAFNDVLSPHGTTSPSIGAMFMWRDERNREGGCFIVDIFKQAGLYTEWLSNQPILSRYDTNTSLIGRNCDRSIFLSKDPGVGVLPRSAYYDEILLPYVQESLEEADSGKLIVVHIMGSHTEYARRYPGNFNLFTDTPIKTGRILNANQVRTINEYDNSIAYTDYILAEIIALVEKDKRPAFVLYVSDHGENVYDIHGGLGHGESPKRVYFEIPMLLWLSSEYRATFPDFAAYISTCLNRPFQTNNLLFMLCDLLKISFDRFPGQKSPLNPLFVPEKRIIAGQDYDSLPSD